MRLRSQIKYILKSLRDSLGIDYKQIVKEYYLMSNFLVEGEIPPHFSKDFELSVLIATLADVLEEAGIANFEELENKYNIGLYYLVKRFARRFAERLRRGEVALNDPERVQKAAKQIFERLHAYPAHRTRPRYIQIHLFEPRSS